MIAAMPTFRLHPLRLIAFALLGSLIVLGGAITAVVALWQPRSLEAMLPGEGTIALFSNVTREDLRAWSDRFPTVRSVPNFAGQLELGILDFGNGSHGWILSSPVKDVPLPETNGTFRGQNVLFSNPKAMDMMTQVPRLRAIAMFQELSRGMSPGASRVYLRTNEQEASAALPAQLRPFIVASGGLLLSRDGEAALIRVYGKPATIHGSAPVGVTAVSPAPDLTLALATPVQMFDRELARFPDTERAVRRGQLTTVINDLLGDEWSLQYDILPLISQTSTFSWKAGTGSMPSFLLRSSTTNVAEMKKRLLAFHESFKTRLTGTIITRHTFDRGFTSAILGSDPAHVEDLRTSVNGWTVRETRQKNGGRVMLSATRGREFIVSNRRGWLKDIVTGTRELPLPTVSGQFVAGGTLSPALFERWTADMRSEPGWMWIRSTVHAKEEVLWGADMEGKTLTVSIRGA